MAELEDFIGKHILSGVEFGTMIRKGWYGGDEKVNCVKFTLDGITYLAVEDPDDGYRSYMEDLVIVDDICKIRLPDIEVVCQMQPDTSCERNNVLVVVDALNGKTILEIGTANYDDYYPYCVMEYTPENMSCNAGKTGE
jgi:hypothetical protein